MSNPKLASILFLGALQSSDIAFFFFLVVGSVVLLIASFAISIWAARHHVACCPYTGFPLRRGGEMPRESAKKVLRFLYDRHEYDNRIFSLKRSAYCRETGFIFQKCVSWMDTMEIDWGFLKKRYPGIYVSWGSLSDLQQRAVREAHHSLAGFQTEFSSTAPLPKDVEKEYVYARPGPLYVDLTTFVLLGWQCVPETEFQVLVVQQPMIYWDKVIGHVSNQNKSEK